LTSAKDNDLYNEIFDSWSNPDTGSDSHEFPIERPPGTDPTRTFSEEAVQTQLALMAMFIAARLHAFWSRTGQPAQHMNIRLDLEIMDAQKRYHDDRDLLEEDLTLNIEVPE
jgi:hypothetical protein